MFLKDMPYSLLFSRVCIDIMTKEKALDRGLLEFEKKKMEQTNQMSKTIFVIKIFEIKSLCILFLP